MATDYRPLSTTILSPGTSYDRPRQHMTERVTPDDPATHVMTDLRRVAAATISPSHSIDDANQRMIASGVRLLLVRDEHDVVVGLVTANDILGEKPMQHLQRVGGTHKDITVADIMTPQEKLEGLHWVDVANARVGDIVETLKRAGRQHALVIAIDESTMKPSLRGIFSATQIGRQLGIEVDTTEIAKTFAELEVALTA